MKYNKPILWNVVSESSFSSGGARLYLPGSVYVANTKLFITNKKITPWIIAIIGDIEFFIHGQINIKYIPDNDINKLHATKQGIRRTIPRIQRRQRELDI